ncbi:MAG: hypothetical protein JKY37_33630 [Nannocystaceae bacterium]|nr:hypothetical protein [Nannocystaceae bacterium]
MVLYFYLLPADSHAAYESVAHGVITYQGPGTCNSSNLTYATYDAMAWDAAIVSYNSAYQSANAWKWLDAQVDGADFWDAGFFYGADETNHYGTDWADVIFFSGHGGHNGCAGSTRWTYLVMGDSNGGACNVVLGSTSNKVILGAPGASSDANYLMMHASVALRYPCAASGNIIYEIDGGGSGAELTLINGLHNSPLDELDNSSEVDDYLFYTEFNAVGDCWGDIMSMRADDVYECSVSSVTSSSASTADNLFFYGGMSDFKDTGSHNQHWYYFDCARDMCGDLPWC